MINIIMSKLNKMCFIKSYWNYYLDLEDQFISTKRFVEFDVSNFTTYSIEYLKLLQAVCSEIDVVAKILSEEYDISFKSEKYISIKKWGFYLQQAYPNIGKITVSFNMDYVLSPWKNWRYERYYDTKNRLQYRLVEGTKVPFWWTSYNKVKHERTSHYKYGKSNYILANQENIINAMAALFILETLYLCSKNEDVDVVYDKSKLFKIEESQI